MRKEKEPDKKRLRRASTGRSAVLRIRDGGSSRDRSVAKELTTVSVPDEMAGPFLKAQDYVSRYFAERVENPSRSTITISGERYILLRAASMSVEFFDLVKSLYTDKGEEEARAVASNLLFDLAHAIGKADARNFQHRMKVTDPIEKLSAGPIHFAFSGWAFVRIHPESRPSADEDYMLTYDHPFSFEADSWVQRGRKSDTPVCIMNAGYSSGWCEESFGLPLVAAEIECLASGGRHCRFVMAPPSRIEEHLARLQRGGRRRDGATISIPEFFQRKRMEDELRSSRDTLEIRVAERTAELRDANERLRREIEDRQAVEQQLRLLGLAVQNAVEGVLILRASKEGKKPRISFVNEGFCRMTGLEAHDTVGKTLSVLQIAAKDRHVFDDLLRHLAEEKSFEAEVTAIRTDGSEIALEMNFMPIAGDSLSPHWVAVLRDVSERKAQLAALERQALHDVLTGLPNRTLLLDRLEQAIQVAQREEGQLALLVMDLDRFKEVNDTFGHQYGDLLLQQVATRIGQQVRSPDTVARLGGDEFAVLLPHVSDAKAASRVARKVLKSLETSFEVEGQRFDVGASVGIALFPLHGTDSSTLLRKADVAMYFAKHSNSGYFIYAVERDDHTPARLALAVDLKEGLEQEQLVLHYQPKIHMRTGLVTRVEALVRWNHPTEGLMLPDLFIPLAERTGLIKPLTNWVLNTALRQTREWHDEGYPIHVAVNLSARSLQETFLPEVIAEMLDRWNVDPNVLKLEITESSILADPPHVLAIISLLQTLGVRLSLDDFGTGYSSLTHLRQLPIDEIKIDKSFIQGMTTNSGDAAIVRAMIDLAHDLGRQVVAEGLQSNEEWRMLEVLGCDLAQGHLLSPPLPAEELIAWLIETGWGVEAVKKARGAEAATSADVARPRPPAG
ncbi:MAG TPA: EAL domain-containing protein [Thermoanaerobaculia bacterium]|nr:EAL domain-containing protein [Thermoanaerobaculia bacterium]